MTPEQAASAAPRAAGAPATVWLEIEDCFSHFDQSAQPSGVQRIAFEILSELERRHGGTGRVRLCRLNRHAQAFEAVSFVRFIRLFRDPPGTDVPWRLLQTLRRKGVGPGERLAVLPRLLRYLVRVAAPALAARLGAAGRRRRGLRLFAPGDVLVCLGGSWINRDYGSRIAALKRARGVRFVQAVHDLIPIRHPDWVPYMRGAFRPWLEQSLANADLILAVSRFTRDDLAGFARRERHAVPPLAVLRYGTGMSEQPLPRTRPRTRIRSAASVPARLPECFVLCVSTIEVRKNHGLLLEVWRRLIERHGADRIPELVCVGRMGWLVEDFLAALEASRHLDGKLRLLGDLDDRALAEAYRRCRFTVFPSLDEGWGLPVAESLAHGRFCVASGSSAIPEVGGDLVAYFDPTDVEDALAKIERAMLDPAYLAAAEARLRAAAPPPSWGDCAAGLMAQIEALAAGAAPGAAQPVAAPALLGAAR